VSFSLSMALFQFGCMMAFALGGYLLGRKHGHDDCLRWFNQYGEQLRDDNRSR
jgi:hypothetical protein